MKTMIIFYSIWSFFEYKWVTGLGSKIKTSQLRFFQKPLIILWDHIFDFGPIFKGDTQRMGRISCISKKTIKKIKYSRSSPDPENSWCGHQQPYNFFSIFADFQKLPDNSGKLKSVDSKQKN